MPAVATAKELARAAQDARKTYDAARHDVDVARLARNDARRERNVKAAKADRKAWDLEQANGQLATCQNSATCDGGPQDPLPTIDCSVQEQAAADALKNYDDAWNAADAARKEFADRDDLFKGLAAIEFNRRRKLRLQWTEYMAALRNAAKEDARLFGALNAVVGNIPTLLDAVDALADAILRLTILVPALPVWKSMPTPGQVAAAMKLISDLNAMRKSIFQFAAKVEAIYRNLSDGLQAVVQVLRKKMEADVALQRADAAAEKEYSGWFSAYGRVCDVLGFWITAFNDSLDKDKALDAATEALDNAVLNLHECQARKDAFQ
jgi:hypothetical protein